MFFVAQPLDAIDLGRLFSGRKGWLADLQVLGFSGTIFVKSWSCVRSYTYALPSALT